MRYNKPHALIAPALCVLFAFSSGNNVPSIAPVQMNKAQVSTGFGQRKNPTTGKEQLHTGIDFRIAEGEPVFATADGIIVESRFDKLRGNYVVVKHDEVYSTSYSHMKALRVESGELVKTGQAIGFVGSTGLSTGPHLHYEVLKEGKAVDPRAYLPSK
jgi:murein DD-endopeptidase MepM/ murein hydrolase activator NlpD